jgi:hypothetical protein
VKRVGRSTYRRIYWGLLLGIFVLLVLSTTVSTSSGGRPSGPPQHPLQTALIWAFFVWLFFGRTVARLLVPIFVSILSCPSCGEEIDAVDVWDCACGFHDHRERHILAGSCPSCGKAAGHINCPRCAATLLLW